MNIQIVMELIELITKYGLPLVTDIFTTWNKPDVTLEDIKALKKKMKTPEEFKKEAMRV